MRALVHSLSLYGDSPIEITGRGQGETRGRRRDATAHADWTPSSEWRGRVHAFLHGRLGSHTTRRCHLLSPAAVLPGPNPKKKKEKKRKESTPREC